MNKRIIALGTTLGSLATTTLAFAADNRTITIPTPTGGVSPDTNIGTVISSLITIVIIVSVIAVLFMLIFGAFEWITSGGDKDAIAKARGRILNALIGLVILSVAFLLVRVVGEIVNIDLTNNLKLPTLQGQ